jgi:hypothetical protein
MRKELEEFYQLFDMAPNISILDINNSCEDMTQTLNHFVSKFDGIVTTLEFNTLEKQKNRVKKASYEYGVICNSILSSKDKSSLMQTIDKGVRDSGYIIVLEKKGQNLMEIYKLFEEFDIGAVSSIDIFEEYDLLMGKKLHMWGMS